MKRRRQRRSVCPVACALDLLGDRWTLLVIRDLFAGKTQFSEFRASPEGIATNVLSERLDRLVEADLVQVVESKRFAGRHAYELTKRGTSLGPVLEAFAQWGLENFPGSEIRIAPKDSD